MATNRLNQLQHQKALLVEHLAWIDQEIAMEKLVSGSNPPSEFNRITGKVDQERPVTASLTNESLPQPQVAAELYKELGPDIRSATADTKKGCLLIGGIAFAGLAALCVYALNYQG